MNKDWPVQPTFALPTYPEYLDTIAQVEGGVINEGTAINLVRFQCSIQYLRDLVAAQKLRSWAVVKGDTIEHLHYSASDLVAHGLKVGWFHSPADLGGCVALLTEDVFDRLRGDTKVEGAEAQPDFFPDGITLKRILSPAEPHSLPHYLIGLHLSNGNRLLEAEATGWDRHIDWIFTRQGADAGESLYSCPPQFFRPSLAAFASRLNLSPYAGHTFFSVRYEDEAAECPGRFSFYLSNTAPSGYWAKLYLYGVTPTPASPASSLK